LRWANDKYKGILAFRATLRSKDDGGMPKRILCAVSALRSRFSSGALRNRFLRRQAAPFQLSTDNFSCCTRQEQRYRQARTQQKLNVAPHLLQLQSNEPGKSVSDVWKKLMAEKKVLRTHFQRVNFVLVCPPVEK
jgi:hypothetical protein